MDENHTHIDTGIRDRFLQYREILVEGSDRLSVVSRGDRERILMRHVRECIEPALLNWVPVSGRWIDIGSGGGLPGIPLALLRKGLKITLLDSREKKVAFLERTTMKLGLSNVVVEHNSLEELPQLRPGQTWDGATARAIAWTPKMAGTLETILSPEAPLIRFGSAGSHPDGVTAIALPLSPDRAVQLWPRTTWPSLPHAS